MQGIVILSVWALIIVVGAITLPKGDNARESEKTSNNDNMFEL